MRGCAARACVWVYGAYVREGDGAGEGAGEQVREGSLPSQEQDKKFSYLWNSRQVLDSAARIVLATDSDAPGQALAEELARRLGRERCWRVRWSPPTLLHPGDAGGGQAPSPQETLPSLRKDANEVLIKDGPEHLQKCIEQAQPFPIRGLFRYDPLTASAQLLHEGKARLGLEVTGFAVGRCG